MIPESKLSLNYIHVDVFELGPTVDEILGRGGLAQCFICIERLPLVSEDILPGATVLSSLCSRLGVHRRRSCVSLISLNLIRHRSFVGHKKVSHVGLLRKHRVELGSALLIHHHFVDGLVDLRDSYFVSLSHGHVLSLQFGQVAHVEFLIDHHQRFDILREEVS